jgi:hypothetical protein
MQPQDAVVLGAECLALVASGCYSETSDYAGEGGYG